MPWAAVELSILVAILATGAVILGGIPLAWALAQRRFWGHQFLETLIHLPLVLPPTVTGYYLLVVFGRRGWLGGWIFNLTGLHLTFSLGAAVLASGVMALPLFVRSARAAFETVDRELELAAYCLGKTPWQTFLQVTLPLARPGLAAGTILAFTRALGEFGATLMLAGNIPQQTQTMPLALYSAILSGEDAVAGQLALILTGISFAAILVTQHLTRNRA